MTEKILQFIWQYRLFDYNNLKSTSGESIEIISPGTINTDSGPDFFNAKIKVNNTILAGNIEIHTKSSDWNIHKHFLQDNYSNIILHAVFENDIINNVGNFPVLELKDKIKETTISKYNEIVSSNSKIPCHSNIYLVQNDIKYKYWLNRIGIERIERKSIELKKELKTTENNWEEIFYIALARNFGFKLNSIPFEILAKSIPFNLIAKYHDKIDVLEALLFGQANLLIPNEDEYALVLLKEYIHLKKKHTLNQMDPGNWKFLRTRPANFPTIRIAEFAGLLMKSNKLFSSIIENPTYLNILSIFDSETSNYWKTHYNFGRQCKINERKLTKDAINNICINTIALFLILWGQFNGNPQFTDYAIELLEQIPAEKNNITNSFSELGFSASNALEGQGLIELKNEYCTNKKCLDCQIGMTILKQ